MSNQPLWNPTIGLDISGLGLSHLGNLVRSDMSGLEVEHVRAGGRTCPANLSGIRL
jgi:hypothetical protein